MIKNKIPKGWKDLSIDQFIEYYLFDREGLELDEMICGELSILLDTSEEEVLSIPMDEITTILESLDWRLNFPEQVSNTFFINNKEYGMLPHNKLTLGEFSTLDEWCKEPIKNMMKIVTLLYRPIVKRYKTDITLYDIDEYKTGPEFEDRLKLFETKLTPDLIFPGLIFFCSIAKTYIRRTKTSLKMMLLNKKAIHLKIQEIKEEGNEKKNEKEK